VLLFAVAFPVLFVMGGAWFVCLGLRSWHGLAPRPSANLVFAGNTARMNRFVDRCILPLGLLYLSLGITLGLAGAAAQLSPSGSGILAVPIGIAAASSVTFLALTISVYRYWKPRRLIPAYPRYEAQPRLRSTIGPHTK
jgi:hypothetical protein